MKRSIYTLVLVGLLLSGCGNKSEMNPDVGKAQSPADESSSKGVAEQPAPAALPDNAPAETLPAPAPVIVEAPPVVQPRPASPAPVAAAKPAQESGAAKGGTLGQEDALALANKSGCLACHRIDSKLVGPAWRDVSARYKGDADAKARLIAKVKAGGKGNWNEATGGVTMPPNSPRVSDENIEKLVSFVLSL